MEKINELNFDSIIEEEVGGEWACIVACIGGCTAAEVVVPGGGVLAVYATAAAAL